MRPDDDLPVCAMGLLSAIAIVVIALFLIGVL
jgi:hypothetical protein